MRPPSSYPRRGKSREFAALAQRRKAAVNVVMPAIA